MQWIKWDKQDAKTLKTEEMSPTWNIIILLINVFWFWCFAIQHYKKFILKLAIENKDPYQTLVMFILFSCLHSSGNKSYIVVQKKLNIA